MPIILIACCFVFVFVCGADENFQIIRKLVEDVGNLFENANQSIVPNAHNNRYDDEEIRVRLQDMDKVIGKQQSIELCDIQKLHRER